jgi:membrane protein involved in colicin uptake
MPEALEKWPVRVLAKLLPRHMQLIEQINSNWLDSITGHVTAKVEAELAASDAEKQKKADAAAEERKAALVAAEAKGEEALAAAKKVVSEEEAADEKPVDKVRGQRLQGLNSGRQESSLQFGICRWGGGASQSKLLL